METVWKWAAIFLLSILGFIGLGMSLCGGRFLLGMLGEVSRAPWSGILFYAAIQLTVIGLGMMFVVSAVKELKKRLNQKNKQ